MYTLMRVLCAAATMAGVAALTHSPLCSLVALAGYLILSVPLAHTRPSRLRSP